MGRTKIMGDATTATLVEWWMRSEESRGYTAKGASDPGCQRALRAHWYVSIAPVWSSHVLAVYKPITLGSAYSLCLQTTLECRG